MFKTTKVVIALLVMWCAFGKPVAASPVTLTHTQDFPAGWTQPNVDGGLAGVHFVFFPGDGALPHNRLIDFGEVAGIGVTVTYGAAASNFANVAAFMSGGAWLGNFGSAFTPTGHAGDYDQLVGGNVFTFPEVMNPLMLFQPSEFSFTVNGFGLRPEVGPCPCSPVYLMNYTFAVTGQILGPNPNPPAPIPEPASLLLVAFGGLGLLSRRRRLALGRGPF